ncbi:MAG: 16S rRNA (uracil(1498)-N(3))-methyltransferase [Putridiphycobacter sp.]|nr:16S rRNA (uracil(1498)-N(3))-methyltransferase [Putridiphycobacter sp.]
MKLSKHLFFCKNIASNTLSKQETHHAVKVLRLKIDDQISLMDGMGTFANARIIDLSKNELIFEVIQKEKFSIPIKQLHIAIAPTKTNERFEFFLEKCTEIGITEVTPILTSNSERKKINTDRWQKIILAAAKQSQSPYLPKLNNLQKFSEFMKQKRQGDKFIAHCEEDHDKQHLKDLVSDAKEICILIGPEGDFTQEEINFAKDQQYKPISLGKSRLRTETAGIVACHTVNIFI